MDKYKYDDPIKLAEKSLEIYQKSGLSRYEWDEWMKAIEVRIMRESLNVVKGSGHHG